MGRVRGRAAERPLSRSVREACPIAHSASQARQPRGTDDCPREPVSDEVIAEGDERGPRAGG